MGLFIHSVKLQNKLLAPQHVPAAEGGLRGVGGGGREGRGGRAGLQLPFVSNGESLPLTVLFSPGAASSQLSRPFEFVLL